MDWLKSVARRADKFRRLGIAEQWLTVRIVGLLVIVRIGLWTMPFRKIQAFAARLGCRRVSPTAKRLSPQELTSLVTVGADYVPAASCLTQALVAQAVLKRYRYEPVLRIGVTRGPAGAFQAHAWVECDGQVIIGQAGMLGNYSTFPDLQPAVSSK
jgi:hypothetical protein